MNPLKKLKLNGVLYSIGETLEDAMRVAPTLDKAPSLITKSYIKNGITINFVIGDLCRVANEESESGYYFYRLHDINEKEEYIWSRLDTGILDESAIITVKITSNQDTTEDLIDKVSIHFECGEDSETITYKGQDIYFVTPSNEQYTITFDARDSNYLAPSLVVSTAQVNARPIHLADFKAEKVTVNVSASDKSSVDDVLITVNNETKVVSDGNLIWTIPYNSIYLIEVSDKEDYTPVISNNNITANQKSREVSVIYYSPEIVNVTVTSNQPAYSEDLNLAEITVNGVLQTYNGETLTWKVPHNTQYTITTSSLAGYRETVSKTGNLTAQGGNVVDVTVKYESEVVSVTCNKTGVDLICNYDKQSYSGTVLKFKVPFGTYYSVTGDKLTGYKVDSQSFTANSVNRDVTVTYTIITVGFKGLKADGTETDTIDSSCIGVVCRDSETGIEFIIGKTSTTGIPWGSKTGDSNDVLEVPSDLLPYRIDYLYDDNADKWYNEGYTGAYNTDIIVNYALEQGYDNTNCAAIWASEQTLDVGEKTLKGYMGCFAEYNLLIKNPDGFINAMFSLNNNNEIVANVHISELISATAAYYFIKNVDFGFSTTGKLYGTSNKILPFFRFDRLSDKEIVNGYEFVDMGLSVKWATCNVGATRPEESGWYFQWGGTTAYKSDRTPVNGGPAISFSWSNYPLCDGSYNSITKYCIQSSYCTVDNKTILEPEDDAAHVHIGGDCRMPTWTEYRELIDACNTTWVTNYNGSGINGKLFTLKSNSSKTLFFPATGYLNNTSWNLAGSYGFYWSSSLYEPYSSEAHLLKFHSNGVDYEESSRSFGHSVRAVLPN